jgi:hypothetical protein
MMLHSVACGGHPAAWRANFGFRGFEKKMSPDSGVERKGFHVFGCGFSVLLTWLICSIIVSLQVRPHSSKLARLRTARAHPAAPNTTRVRF